MQTVEKFQYIYSNLSLYQFHMDWILAGMVIGGGIVAILVTYMLIRIVALLWRQREERLTFKKKKKLLDDLVLMKDIQTELEKEIEQAILKSAFQS